MAKKIVVEKAKKRGRKKGFKAKDFSDLKADEYVQKWLSLTKEAQRRKKLGILQKYVDFTGLTPTELILEHHKDLQKEPIKRTEIGKIRIKNFFRYLKGEEINGKKVKKPKSHNSARQYAFSKVASFYKRCGVGVEFLKGEVPREHKNVKSQAIRENGERIGLDEEKELLKKIRDALPYLRTKAIFHCKISSGLLDADIFNLKVKDFEDGLYPDLRVCYIEGNRQKSDIRFQSFFNSEAVDFLDLYISERKSKGETITKKSWLFADLNGNGEQIYEDQFRKQLAKTTKMLGIKNLTPKSLRRYFNHVGKKLLHADSEIIERMMGHVGSISAKYQPYFDYPDDLAKLYSKQLDSALCLGNGNHTKTKITDLENEITEMKEEMTTVRKLKERYELESKELREEVNTLKDVASKLTEQMKFFASDQFKKVMASYEIESAEFDSLESIEPEPFDVRKSKALNNEKEKKRKK